MKLTEKEKLLLKKKPSFKRKCLVRLLPEELRGMHEKVYNSGRISTPKKGKGSYNRSKLKRDS